MTGLVSNTNQSDEVTASELHITALDDYEFTIPLEEIRGTKVLLATKAEGEHMTVADGGPTRIIFSPDSQFGQNPGRSCAGTIRSLA
jgi:hypothetical protein